MTESYSTSSKRVAAVTGAAEGIGRGICFQLAKDGLDLGLFDLPRAQERLEGLAESLRKQYGTKVVTVYGDVSVEDDITGFIDTVVQELGGLYAVSAHSLRVERERRGVTKASSR